MRLIDKDDYRESLIYCKGLGRHSLEAVLEHLEKQSTIEAEPVKHGKWIDCVEYICSVDAELEAILLLLNNHKKKHKEKEKQLFDRERSLRTICKLNRSIYHDEAIDALSDVDNYEG